MRPTAELPQLTSTIPGHAQACAARGLSVEALRRGQEGEVLEFLSERPLHTVYMAGFIRDNGLESPLNRGTFYGCRTPLGRLQGVALIGHITQMETRTAPALEALARAAQSCSSAHVIMGEQEKVQAFWSHYADEGQPLRLVCRELLMEQCPPAEAPGGDAVLRRATPEDLHLVMPVQAEMAVDECGIDPLVVDPSGFRKRCARRIERGRVWVVVEAGRLLFKADVMAETDEAAYLEGVYVAPGERGRGHGRRYLLQLGRVLGAHSRSVCLLVNEKNRGAQACYFNAGYRFRCYYETIYLHKNN